LVAYAHQQSSSAQVRSWLSLLIASAELFCGEVAAALSAKIARLEMEDQQAVVTELRTHEQGLLLFLGLGVLVCRRGRRWNRVSEKTIPLMVNRWQLRIFKSASRRFSGFRLEISR
jgi:hypothetical protein